MIGMEGHQVTIRRVAPHREIYGTLKRYSDAGATIWVAASYGGEQQSGNIFVPARLIIEIVDHGELPR
jgi:hypothetical protein